MKFVHPHVLWGVAAMIPLFLIILWDERLRRLRFGRFAAEATWKFLAPELDFRARIRKGFFLLLAAAFAFVALARPQWGEHEESSKSSGLDVMFVLDISNSMEVEDIIPNRLAKAKHEIRSLVERLQGDRVGIVAFAASAQVSCPLTTDLSYLLDTVQILNPSLAMSQGTDLGLGIETARKSIERGGEDAAPETEGEKAPQPSQAIVLMTDGEDQEDTATDVAKKVRESGMKLYIIGVGSEKGGPIPVRDETGNLVGYKKDRRGQTVVSHFDPTSLNKLAQLGNGQYWSASENETEVDSLINDLGGLNRAEFAERKYMVFEDRFQFPLAVAILLLLIEMMIPSRKIIKKGKRRAGTPKASSSLAGLTLLLLTYGLFGSRAEAAPIRAYLENEKGIQSLKDGKVEDAKKEFGTAQAVSPDSPELEFNQGVVQLQQGDADSAIKSFQDSYQKSEGKDPRFSAKSLYNLGVAQTKKGDFKGAVKSYLSAIDQSQRSGNPQLEAESRKNLELLAQEKQKQQQKKQDQKQKQDQQQKDQKDQQKKDEQQKQDQQSKDQKDQQQKQKEDEKQKQDQQKADSGDKEKQQYEDPKQQQFKSQKMTKDDADRVMEELKHREKELQTKLNKKNANTQNNVNDW